MLWCCRHGDLKAGNVLLQANTDVSSAAPGGFGQDVLEVWMAAGCVPLTGKVAGGFHCWNPHHTMCCAWLCMLHQHYWQPCCRCSHELSCCTHT